MFWEKEYNYTVIGENVTTEDLKEFLKENDIFFEIADNATEWCAFAQWYAHRHGFGIIKSTSFAYMVSLFMTGMGISASTEMYFREEQLELDLIDKLNEIKSEDIPEAQMVRKMFKCIYLIYRDDITKYEYATERLSLRLTPSEMEKFMSLEGQSNKEKFKTLLDKL